MGRRRYAHILSDVVQPLLRPESKHALSNLESPALISTTREKLGWIHCAPGSLNAEFLASCLDGQYYSYVTGAVDFISSCNCKCCWNWRYTRRAFVRFYRYIRLLAHSLVAQCRSIGHDSHRFAWFYLSQNPLRSTCLMSTPFASSSNPALNCLRSSKSLCHRCCYFPPLANLIAIALTQWDP